MADNNPQSLEIKFPNNPQQQQQAIRLKTLAESKFNISSLKSALNYANRAHNLCPNLTGLTEMLTAFKILYSAKNPRKSSKNSEHPFPSPELYDILGVTPFSSISLIKTQFKKLALLLHPDKNTLKTASDEAFKLVNYAFQVFSDKRKQREYDTRLRLALLEEREVGEEEEVVEMFSTSCSDCGARSEFEREFVGQRLVCPGCGRSFRAVEGDDSEESEIVGVRNAGFEDVGVEDWEKSSLSELVRDELKGKLRIDRKKVRLGPKRKMGSLSEMLERVEPVRVELPLVEETIKCGRKQGKKGAIEVLESEKLEICYQRSRRRSGVVEEEVEKSKKDERKRGRGRVKDVEGLDGVEDDKGKEVGNDWTLAEEEVEKSKKDERKRGRSKDVEELVNVGGDKGKEVGNDLTLSEEEVEKSKKDERKRGRGRVKDVEGLDGVEGDKGEEVGNDCTLAEEEVEKSKKDERKRGRRRVKDVEGLDGVEGDKDEEVGNDWTLTEEEAEKLIKDERKRGRGRTKDVEGLDGVEGDKGEEAVIDLTLAELQMEALKKLKGKESGRKKVTVREDVEEEVALRKGRRMLVGDGDMEVMLVEDSDFYDFDGDRVERSFKKGQIWAIYDDDDGMPRLYGLIDEVVSVNPFEMKISWLDFLNDGDAALLNWEKMGFHISCGSFRVARRDIVRLLNIFSHMVECERAARELFRIYPKKGSVWALYNYNALAVEEKDPSTRDQRHYDIVVFLTSYDENYGLSMAYLEKVDGYKAVFRRREIGYQAIRWLEKDDVKLLSHQIPARKLSEDEAPAILGNCWELDPASLPLNLLTVIDR